MPILRRFTFCLVTSHGLLESLPPNVGEIISCLQPVPEMQWGLMRPWFDIELPSTSRDLHFPSPHICTHSLITVRRIAQPDLRPFQ